MISTSCKVDASRANAGIALALKYTRRTPAQVVNTAAYFVAIVAKQRLPYVTVERVDTELGVAVTLQRKKRGKGFLRAKRTQALTSGRRGDIATSIPLGVLIMIARQRSDSRYNRRTNSRYALPPGTFRGSGGRARLSAAISRMIKGRHSSIKFLIAGWIPAIRTLAPHAVQKYARAGGPPPLDGQRNTYSSDLGSATPAVEGGLYCVAVIENAIGMSGPNAANFNRALHEHGDPALQYALDHEGYRQMQYALSKIPDELLALVQPMFK